MASVNSESDDTALHTYDSKFYPWPNVVLMLARRLRRRPNIKTTLVLMEASSLQY